jgi:hypothetical protein
MTLAEMCAEDKRLESEINALVVKRYELTKQIVSAEIARDLQEYLIAVAAQFEGALPADAWHLYRAEGLTPIQAAAKHRQIAKAAAVPASQS